MSDEFDNFIEALQEEIFNETKAAYGDVFFERWRHLRYMGKIDNPDAYAAVTGSCGDTIQIFLNFENDRVKEASFLTDGCGSSAVCGSFAAEMAHGKNPNELLEVSGEAILQKLGGLPEEDEHCAFLASETLADALKDYMIKQRQKDRRKEDERQPEGLRSH
ncbi:MAG: iron-sulfur cluster assembly scaffold protein [Deltaproteobacteria bacterium]|nr:iron-sulfur cluster assembly scaffold protein [Deltaproteobacteria bacterium]MBW2085937.1 iron-sulfur cluster assembly scaffold protein [Deltaproteobacteria bacterium]